MEYKYHSQHQAESFANSIISVPDDYPLKAGLPDDFRKYFAAICKLAKDIYMDMAKQPEAYGVMLLDINETDYNRARDSYRTIHRFGDTLNALFLNGKVENHCLTVDAAQFNMAAKKINKYKLMLSKICDFGFVISNINGTIIVEYPDNPKIIDVLKIYCDEWLIINKNRQTGGIKERKNNNLVRLAAEQFHHHFYRFDYKSTADLEQIPMLTWVNDEADYQGFDSRLKKFNEAFYLESLKYDGVQFDGDYNYKSKRIARITQVEFNALGKAVFVLSLKLPKPDKYMDIIYAMPDSIKGLFSKNYCRHCVMQKDAKCKMRFSWTYDDVLYEGCAYQCFNFTDFDVALVPQYWRLLELEYGL